MSRIGKYFKLRNYIEKLRWLSIFRNSQRSSIGANAKIHSSSKILNSKLGNNVNVNESTTISNCEIGSECKILADCYLSNVSLGNYSYINSNSFVLRARIGKFCSIASHVYIGPGTHPMDFISTHPFTFLKEFGNLIPHDDDEIIIQRDRRSIDIGNDVWIGQGVIIMDRIKIGDGAIVGAHAVVTKDVEPYAIVVGNPAKKIRSRYSEDMIKALIAIKWWDWEKAKLRERVRDFRDIKSFIEKHTK